MKKRVILLAFMFVGGFYGVSSAAESRVAEPQKKVVKSQSKKKISKPRVGVKVSSIPRTKVSFTYKNKPYHFFDGVIYVAIGNQYQVVEMEKGMIIPSLPRNEVRVVTIGDKVYYEHSDVLYQAIETTSGTQYQVVGWLND